MKAHGIEVITRGVCIVEGCVLLCHGRGHDNTYLPGGHIEVGESAASALAREIKEELGVAASTGRFLGAVENQFVQKGRPVHEINLLFRLEIPGLKPGTEIPVAEEWLDFRWAPLESLADANLQPQVVRDVVTDHAADAGGVGWGSSYPSDRGC
ncbi:MAG: NUDIX domain-containing protein [Verrucomicrobia bacterium]|jgi:8-oxo-dGTP diphosphatase|nr:NUDIX domain-containing protein [Verrucomicrobiota bacterium]MBT7068651.1 NUDIX domain-containing protein [Verrucomicrobiota bacterium]MBT7701668.1 NUDIX domain-containing protein [Verrucomicrobiota bacterium]